MMQKILFLVVFSTFLAGSINAQCSPDRAGILKYIKSVMGKNDATPAEGVKVLTAYLAAMDRCAYKNDSVHIYLLTSLAVLYYKQSDFLAAAGCYRRCIDIMKQNQGKPDLNPKKLLTAYYWLSEMYEALDNFPEKMKAVNNCINTALQLRDSSYSGYMRSLDARVKYDFDLGDYKSCISDAIIWEKVALNYLRLEAKTQYDTLVSKTSVLGSLGWSVEAMLALKDFAAAEKFLEEKMRKYQKTIFDNFLGYLYSFQAEVQIQKGDYTRARSLFQRGLDYSQRAERNYTCKQVLNLIGNKIYFTHYNDAAKAMDCYRNALAFKNNIAALEEDDKMESLNILANMANVFTRQGRYDSASIYFRRAFDQLGPGLNEASILQRPPEVTRSYKKIHYLQSLLLDKADMFQHKYRSTGNAADIGEAARIYKLADQLLDRMRSAQKDPESKLFWRRDIRRLYEHAIHACYLLGDAATAFYFFEKSRAVLLNDQLAQQQWMRADDMLKQAQLKKQITGLQNKMNATEASSGEYPGLQAQLFQARQELDNLEQLIKTQSPLYTQRNDTTHLSLPETQQKLLKDHAGLLEIYSGDSAGYTLFITRSQVFLSKISKTDFDNTAVSYMSYISNRERLNKDFAGFRNTAFRLYRLVFQNHTIPKGRIIISPDGPLFPFESLITDSSAGDAYFLRDHAVSYTYSARYLLNDFMSTTTTSSGNLLGVAPVMYNTSAGLPVLTGSDISLQKLGSYIRHSAALIRDNASRHSFLQQFPAYKIIQLYTHAADSSDRKEPVIYFADSSLYLSDLMPEQIPVTQLVVLSACNTGNGKLYQGEGVFSFNRGFAALGIPSSVSNLWSIDNISTYQLTENFYKYLARGLPIDEALQMAKLEFMEKASGENKLPYHWAPAILVGKTNPIAYKRNTNWKMTLLYIGAAGILILALFWYRRK